MGRSALSASHAGRDHCPPPNAGHENNTDACLCVCLTSSARRAAASSPPGTCSRGTCAKRQRSPRGQPSSECPFRRSWLYAKQMGRLEVGSMGDRRSVAQKRRPRDCVEWGVVLRCACVVRWRRRAARRDMQVTILDQQCIVPTDAILHVRAWRGRSADPVRASTWGRRGRARRRRWGGRRAAWSCTWFGGGLVSATPTQSSRQQGPRLDAPRCGGQKPGRPHVAWLTRLNSPNM